MKHKGVLIVVSGFSGAGKGTLMKELVSRYDEYALSVSMTTREPRPGETEGKSYYFESKEEFERMIQADELLEYACYCDNYYGTPRKYVENQLHKGKNVILEIELQGALKIREKFPEAVLIFVLTPTAKELKKRLKERGTETHEVIEKRLLRACEEAEHMEKYDFLLINDKLDTCVEELHDIIRAAKFSVVRNHELILKMKEDLKGFVKGES